jgi:hypothetical protein
VFDKPTKVSSIIKSCRLMASIVARYKKRELNHMEAVDDVGHLANGTCMYASMSVQGRNWKL